MLTTGGVAVFLGTWASLYLLDAFLKTNEKFSRAYTYFLERCGVTVSIGQIRWYTTCMNRLFLRLGQMKPRFLRWWFTCGVLFGLIAMFLAIFLLSLMIFNTFRREQHVEQQVLTPVMPGVNLPMSQVGYYLMTLLVCGILHEVGHALAAVREQVRVNGFGIFFLALYPGAFVDLYTEHLQVISPLRQLRIYCAGVWHNFIIVLLAIAVLGALPWLLMPFYTTGNSVVITYVLEKSPVDGPRGLNVGEHITSLSGCRVTSVDAWQQCVQNSMSKAVTGYCIPSDQIKQQDTSSHSFTTSSGNVECCSNISQTHICFVYHSKAESKKQYACLPARATIDNKQVCTLPSDCYNPKREHSCVYPSLDNTTRILKVVHGRKTPLLFLGHPLDLLYSVTVGDYVPDSILVPVSLPYVLETFCKYLISLSGALAILNVVPCYALDGQWILYAFIELTLSPVLNRENRGIVFTILLLCGTLLIMTNIVMALWSLFNFR
ncbi:membrane-bound transcription factor site-2 protease-like [Lineus longissimus]|uniref:membrane-bound transcription factor site-2 protease-like n=1 Tax=Lineus longissimus TaxID=88925 RepID=UPI002B4D6395